MRDIIVPPSKKIMKSRELHGHLCIDIHNTNSGFTERYEQDNTVTTAANEFMWLNYLAYLRNGSAQRPASVAEGLYGGACLFQDAITGGTMLPLGSNHLVGYAGTGTTVTGDQGVYNASESYIRNGSATTVWDWGTSQANGTISAVARTNVMIGNGYMSNFEYSPSSYIGSNYGYEVCRFTPQDNSSYSYRPIGIDTSTEKIYFFNQTQSAFFEMPFSTRLTIEQGVLNALNAPLSSSSISMICSTANTETYRHIWYNQSNHKIYWAKIKTYGTSNEGVIQIYSVDVSADEPEETMNEVTMTGCYIYNNSTPSSVCNVAFSDGYLYVSGYDPDDTSAYGIYQLKLSNNQTQFYSIKAYAEAQGLSSSQPPVYIYPWGTGGIAFFYAYYYEIKMDQDGTYWGNKYNAYYSYYGFHYSQGAGAGADVAVMKLSKYFSYSYILPYDYMGTYANLNSPITKTNSETMKLTYTLTDTV